jgi:hypothetical protein
MEPAAKHTHSSPLIIARPLTDGHRGGAGGVVQLSLTLQLVGVQVHDVHYGLAGQQEPRGALVLQVEGAVLVRRVLRACLLRRCGVKGQAVNVSQRRTVLPMPPTAVVIESKRQTSDTWHKRVK